MDIQSEMAVARRASVGDIIRRGARRQPDQVAVIMGDRRLTYRQLDEMANRVAHGLIARGLGRGAKISALGRNSVEFLVLYLAVAKAGAILCPANPALPDQDLAFILSHAEVDAVFVDAAQLERVAALARQCPSVRHVFALAGNIGSGVTALADLLADAQPATDPDIPLGERDVAMIMYTSGTTAAPKGAMLSHLAVTMGAIHNSIAGEVDEGTVATAILPLFHCGQLSITSGTLLRGGTVVIFDRFEADELLSAIERERVTWIFALPAMYRELLAHPRLDSTDLSSLKFCLYAMVPMDHTTLKRGIEKLGARFALTSGQTEAYPPTVVFTPEYQLIKEGSYWGKALPVVEVALMGDDGQIVEDGSVGEIVYRGPVLMEGYLKDPEATARAFAGGWFHSGDLGQYDQDGLLLFVDRKKDLIKSGGESVASIRVERCLLSHTGVTLAAAVGIPHPRWGEAVVAAVVTAPNASPTEAELVAHCKQHLAPFEVPKAVVIRDRLPQTATGKVQKFALRRELAGLFAETSNT